MGGLLLTASNPESGAITYTYDADSNLLTKVSPAPNQTGSATVTTTYSYDGIHRLTGKTYSNGDPAVSYFYDQITYNGLTITNGSGRRTGMSDGSGQTAWSFDSEGRPITEQRTISGVTKTFQYSYNLDGSLASLTWSNNRTLSFAYNAAARLTAATETYNGVTNNYATAATYAPQGALAGVTYGKVTGGFAGIFSVLAYNKRLQPTDIMATTGALDLSCTNVTGKVLHLNYNFALGTADNGNVQTINNCRNTARTQSFTYDQLNRVLTAVSTANSGTNCWGENFGYDIWGNLLSRSAGKTDPTCQYEGLSVSVTPTDGSPSKNRIVGYCYDSAGNLLGQTNCTTYTYNAENRITATAGVTYTYDGDGHRVKKSSGTLYYYIPGTDSILQESDLAGNTRYRYVFFNGKRIMRRNSSTGEILYYFSDHLGSSNVVTNATGSTIKEESDFYPFGGERVVTDTVSDQNYKFTGKERDTESNLDYFGARYYSSNLGRFITPDWAAAPTAVPYANVGNPQTLNLYSYVANNPLLRGDPDGHCPPCAPSELADHLDAKINAAVTYLQNKAVNSGNSVLAAQITFAAGSYGDAGKGLTNLLRTGESVGSLPSEASTGRKIAAVAEEAGRVGGTMLLVISAAGPKVPATSEQGAGVAADIGKNRVTLDNGSQVDLAGKAHFDKGTGESVPTPHIKDPVYNTDPATGTTYQNGYGTTRGASVGDVNAAARAAGAKPPVTIPPPLPVPKPREDKP